MRIPLLLRDEAARLAALSAYGLLDTRPEPSLDDLTKLAAQICEAPISLISLIDEHRQWFLSRVGLDVPETPRDVSFCAHAILQPELMIVPDTALDTRFADNPLVTGEPGIRFYAGMPLSTPDGHALGTLCVIDRIPRQLTPRQQDALRVLSRQVMAQVELRRQTRELSLSEARLKGIFQSCPVALTVNRWEDRTFVDVNESFTAFLGWDREEVLGRTAVELQLVDGEAVARLRQRLASGGPLRDQEMTIRTRSGDPRRVMVGASAVEWFGERHIIASFVDVTEREQAQAALRDRERRLRAIVDTEPECVKVVSRDGRLLEMNAAGLQMLQAGTLAQAQERPLVDFIVPEHRRAFGDLHRQVMNGHNGTIAFEVVGLEGRRRWLETHATPLRDADGSIQSLLGITRDITERLEAEQTLRASEARYRTLFDRAPDGIIITSPGGAILDVNDALCRMLGYEREELLRLVAADILIPAEHVRIDAAYATVGAGLEVPREWHFRRQDGSGFTADVVATQMPDGNPMGVIRDITERQRAEARLRRLVESNVQGVMFWRADGAVTGANDAFLRIAGYSRLDLEAGRLNSQALSPIEYAGLDRHGREQLAKGGVIAPYQTEYIRKDGTRVPVLVGAAAFEDDASEGVSFVVDLTESKALERQVLRAQRMESIGTLAGGIAHDLNNVLTPILMSIELLREGVAEQRVHNLLDVLESSAKRGAALVKQVLTFASGVEGRRIAVDPVQVIRDLLAVMRDTLPKDIEVTFTAAPNILAVTGDPTQIHQVLLNLCVNARDAMPHGGRLHLAIENVTLDHTYTSMNVDARPGPYVVVQVVDTGGGIPEEIRERIFEPFFTTKEVGKGTGLGLSTMQAIVKSHGGFVNLYSEIGIGTTFRVYLPADSSLKPGAGEAASATLPRGHGEVVLVVDDEPAVRGVAQTTLERFGYRVLQAGNGAEAVALYAQRREEIAVVLVDMSMPVMDGPACIAALLAIDPAVRIVGSSGMATNQVVAQVVSAGVTHFVPKPYTAEVLLRTLHLVLSGRSPN